MTLLIFFLNCIAICGGKINSQACNIHYYNDMIIYRPGAGNPQRDSGGYCANPDQCAGCHDGFYSDRAYCRGKDWYCI